MEDYSQCTPVCYSSCLCMKHPPTKSLTPKSQHVVNCIYCMRWARLTELTLFTVTLWCLCYSVSLNAEVGSSKHINSAYPASFSTTQHLTIQTASTHTHTWNSHTSINIPSNHIILFNNMQYLCLQGVGFLLADLHLCVCVCAAHMYNVVCCATAGVVLVLLLTYC